MQTCATVIYSSISSSKSSNEDEQNQAGLLRFNISDHIPIIFSLVLIIYSFLFSFFWFQNLKFHFKSEVSGRTLHRTEVKELSKESEQETLSNVMPMWIIDPLVNVGYCYINCIHIYFASITSKKK